MPKDLAGIGKAVGETSKAIASVYKEEVKARYTRFESKNKTQRKRIDANVKMLDIREKAKTKRAGVIRDEIVTFRNTSDEVLSSFDTPVLEIVKKSKGGKQLIKARLSLLSIMGLLSPILSSSNDPRLQSIGNVYRTDFVNMYQHPEYFQRNTSAGGISLAPSTHDDDYETMMNGGVHEEDEGTPSSNTSDLIQLTQEQAGVPTTKETGLTEKDYNDAYHNWIDYWNKMRGKYGWDKARTKMTETERKKLYDWYKELERLYMLIYRTMIPFDMYGEKRE